MTTLPILYSFRRCPYAMRARMAVMQSGMICELREVVLRNKPDAMIDLSPKGTVPVLQLPDGRVLEESLDVMRWALDLNDPDGWLETYEESAELILRLDGEFKDALDRYKYFVNHPEHPQSHYREQGAQFLTLLEDRLAENGGTGLFGPRMTFADFAAIPFVRQFAFVDKSWFDQAPYPLLHGWLNRVLESDLFLSVMPKYPAWKPGDGPVMFGQGHGT
jgi:glutathione S-transferase